MGRSEELKKLLAKEEEALGKVVEAKKKADEELSAEQAKLAESAKQIAMAEEKIAAAKAAIVEAEKLIAAQTTEIEKQRESEAKIKTAIEAKSKTVTVREQALVTAQQTRDQAAAKIPAHEKQIQLTKNRVADFQQQLETLHRLDSSPNKIEALAISTDHKNLATVHQSGLVKVFDWETGTAKTKTSFHPNTSVGARWNACFLDPDQPCDLLGSCPAAIPQHSNPMGACFDDWRCRF